MSEFRYDFDRIRAEVTVPMVLAHYGITNLKQEGEKWRTACPFQNGGGKTALILWPTGWKCHSCGRKGSVLHFVMDKEGLPREDSKSAVAAAKLIYDWFGMNGAATEKPHTSLEGAADYVAHDTAPEKTVNEALKFTLKDVDAKHPYFTQRGFEVGHVEYLGAGYFRGKGSMAGRVVFPIHNAKGELVSYAGRLVDDSQITDENPRWRLGKGFRKTLELYNLHRVLRGGFDSVVIVESFWGALACVRAGILNVVATMGHDLSDAQAALLDQFRHITLLYDGDEPGRQGSVDAGAKLLTRRFASVRVLFLAEGTQPDHRDSETLQQLIW